MNINFKRRILAAAAAVALLGLGARLARAQTYTTISDPFAEGGASTVASGISGSDIVGYYTDSNNYSHGFTYNGTAYTALDDPQAVTGPAQGTFARGISGTNIVGYYSAGNGSDVPFLYDGTSYSTLNLDPPQGTNTVYATGISGNNVVGYFRADNGIAHGFLYNLTNPGNYTEIRDPFTGSSTYYGTVACGISGTNVVGYFEDSNNNIHGFLYNGTTYTTLDDPAGFNTRAYGISGNDIVGSYETNQGNTSYSHGFLYNGTTYTTLDDPLEVGSFTASTALGIFGSSVVGHYFSQYVTTLGSQPVSEGFLYTSGDAPVPSAPTGLTAVAGSGQVTLTWNTSLWATSYSVFRGTAERVKAKIASDIASTNYVDTGLTNNEIYYYTVAAVNPTGTRYSSVVESTTLIPPTHVVATAATLEISLTWISQPGETAYAIYRGTSPGVEHVSLLAAGYPYLMYTDRAVTVGETYYYAVAATSDGSTSGYSNEASAAPEAPPVPGAPTGLAASPGASLVVLTWSGSEWATSYNVYRGTTAGGEGLAPIRSNLALPGNTDTSVTNGVTYYYRVTAVDVGGTSGYSNEVNSDAGVPESPSGLTAAVGDELIRLTWTAGPRAASFQVYRGTAAGSESAIAIATGISGASFVDHGLVNGVTYYYQVAGVNAFGTGGLSNEAHGAPTANPPPPPAPTFPSANVGFDWASIGWTASPGALSYNIYRGTSSGCESSTPVATGITDVIYNDLGLVNGTTYWYRVAALGYGGLSAYSAEVSAIPTALGVPSITPGLIATAGFRTVSLNWLPAAGAVAYNVVRGTASGGENEGVGTTTSTNFADAPLINGIRYYYRVFATCGRGGGAYSNEASGTPNAGLLSTKLRATAFSTQVLLNWATVPGAASYNVYMGTAAGDESATPVATGITGSSYLTTGLTNNTAYYFRVAALFGTGENGRSNEVSSTPRAVAAGVFAWGDGEDGELGDGVRADKSLAVPVTGLSDVTNVAGGEYHSLALKSDGTVWGWGDNTFGELGDGTTNGKTEPVPVSGLANVTAISAGGNQSMALKSDGTVWAWGENDHGQLGFGSAVLSSSIPVQVSQLSGVTAISVGGYHCLALKSDGTVWAWGWNGFGELGDGSTTDSSVPVQVSGLTGVAAIAAGGEFSLALKSDGSVWAWGYNGEGELGNGTTTGSSVPVAVNGLTGVTAIAGGQSHSLALKSDGTAWAWGYNGYAQLGNASTMNSSVPVQVLGLTGVTQLASGAYHSEALRSDGTVWAWGGNIFGELGIGAMTTSNALVQVVGLGGMNWVSAGGFFGLAASVTAPAAR